MFNLRSRPKLVLAWQIGAFACALHGWFQDNWVLLTAGVVVFAVFEYWCLPSKEDEKGRI